MLPACIRTLFQAPAFFSSPPCVHGGRRTAAERIITMFTAPGTCVCHPDPRGHVDVCGRVECCDVQRVVPRHNAQALCSLFPAAAWLLKQRLPLHTFCTAWAPLFSCVLWLAHACRAAWPFAPCGPLSKHLACAVGPRARPNDNLTTASAPATDPFFYCPCIPVCPAIHTCVPSLFRQGPPPLVCFENYVLPHAASVRGMPRPPI